MNRRLIVLLFVLVALAVALPATLRLGPSLRSAKAKRKPPADLPAWAPAAGKTDHLDAVTVTIKIPAAAEFPEGVASGAGCPQKELSSVLGVAVSPGQGCVVLKLDENGPAAKAGIQLGDRLSSEPDGCPSSLAGKFLPSKEAREITWTVQRPVLTSTTQPAPAKLAPS
jgi:hypothetical protein